MRMCVLHELMCVHSLFKDKFSSPIWEPVLFSATPRFDVPENYNEGLIFREDEVIRIKVPFVAKPTPKVRFVLIKCLLIIRTEPLVGSNFVWHNVYVKYNVQLSSAIIDKRKACLCNIQRFKMGSLMYVVDLSTFIDRVVLRRWTNHFARAWNPNRHDRIPDQFADSKCQTLALWRVPSLCWERERRGRSFDSRHCHV